MRVLKFGGSSVKDAERLQAVAEIVTATAAAESVAVVVSALGGTTEALIEALIAAQSGMPWRQMAAAIASRHLEALGGLGTAGRKVAQVVEQRLRELEQLLDGVWLLGECPVGARHRILATGERLAAPILAAFLEARGCAAEAIDGCEVLVRPDEGAEGRGMVHPSRERARQRLAEVPTSTVPVITGFVVAGADGRPVTLSRGGSDLSATVLAAALEAAEVEIWSDVDGVLSAPPTLVRGARPLPTLSATEAAELAFFGAKVLHPRCLDAVAGRAIPVSIRNTLRPQAPGTVVRHDAVSAGVRALAAVENAVQVELAGSAMATLPQSLLGNVLVVSASSVRSRWQLAVAQDVFVEHRECLTRVAKGQHEVAVVALVGGDATLQPWPMGRALETLARAGVQLAGVAAAAGSCSAALVVDRQQMTTVLNLLHDALMLERRAQQEAQRRVA